MKGRVFILLLVIFWGFSCRNSKSKTSEFVFPQSDSVPVSEAEKLSPEAIADISKNISSPVEIANLLQTLQVPFSQSYLAESMPINRVPVLTRLLNWVFLALIWDILICMKKQVLRWMFSHQ
jgi:hypothetical protein